MKIRNENQSKHIANSLRIIGMAQFAVFGYPALMQGDWYRFLVFGIAYVLTEAIAYTVLHTKQEDT